MVYWIELEIGDEQFRILDLKFRLLVNDTQDRHQNFDISVIDSL